MLFSVASMLICLDKVLFSSDDFPSSDEWGRHKSFRQVPNGRVSCSGDSPVEGNSSGEDPHPITSSLYRWHNTRVIAEFIEKPKAVVKSASKALDL